MKHTLQAIFWSNFLKCGHWNMVFRISYSQNTQIVWLVAIPFAILQAVRFHLDENVLCHRVLEKNVQKNTLAKDNFLKLLKEELSIYIYISLNSQCFTLLKSFFNDYIFHWSFRYYSSRKFWLTSQSKFDVFKIWIWLTSMDFPRTSHNLILGTSRNWVPKTSRGCPYFKTL